LTALGIEAMRVAGTPGLPASVYAPARREAITLLRQAARRALAAQRAAEQGMEAAGLPIASYGGTTPSYSALLPGGWTGD
jgi:hypothetical protein